MVEPEEHHRFSEVLLRADEDELDAIAEEVVSQGALLPAVNTTKRLVEEAQSVEKAAFLVAEKKLIEAKVRHNHFLDRSVVFSTLVKAKDIETCIRLREEIRRKFLASILISTLLLMAVLPSIITVAAGEGLLIFLQSNLEDVKVR